MGITVDKISVIVPVHNAQEYLEKCIDSIIRQDYKNIEILLVEDSSEDNSAYMCSQYEKQYDNIKVFSVNFNSAAKSRNYGLKMACGQFIVFSDSDDYFTDNNCITDMYNNIKINSSDIAVGNYLKFVEGQLYAASPHSAISAYETDTAAFRFEGFFATGTLSYVWAKMYRMDFLQKCGIEFKDLSYAEDKLFNFECYVSGAKYSFLDKAVYVYRHNISSVSNSYRKESYKNWLEVAAHIYKLLVLKNVLKQYGDLAAFTIFFAAFFDGKQEYVYNGKTIRNVRFLLMRYADDKLTQMYILNISHGVYVKDIPSRMWRIIIRGFAVAMRFHMYWLLGFGIKLLIDLKIDEKLSDIGAKNVVAA